MLNKFKLLILFFLAISVSACGSVKEGFTMKKKENSDEFLVEKKSPLILPPDYNELPVPQEGIIEQSDENKEIKTLIEKIEDTSSNNSQNIDKTFEETLLEKIKNN
tara:strand:+ start:146 stop:463 length:318 start_codon:yes stop_codon:yes gene_type:complete